MKLHAGVIGEEIDGEVVMIDLSKGIYYSLRGSSVVLWRVLRDGAPSDAVVACVEARIDNAPPGAVKAGVDQLITALQRDELLLDDGELTPTQPDAGVVDKIEFAPFEYERFDDMASLILLDPVHDIDPSHGWPKPLA